MDSETALERTYADLTMILRPEMRRFQLLDILIEFKYVRLQEAGISGPEAQALSVEALKALAPIEQCLIASESKLRGYREILERTYGDPLRLRAYSVVSLGFERLVWREYE